jgi:hypothetical protein
VTTHEKYNNHSHYIRRPEFRSRISGLLLLLFVFQTACLYIYILNLHWPRNCSYLCCCSVILVIFSSKPDILSCNSLHSSLTASDCFSGDNKRSSCSMKVTRTISVALWTDRLLVGSVTPCSLLYNYWHLIEHFSASVMWVQSAQTVCCACK